MAAVETNIKVYLFYQALYQYNTNYMEAFKDHLRVSEASNEAMGYHIGLSTAALLDKHNINRLYAIKVQKTEANLKAREMFGKH